LIYVTKMHMKKILSKRIINFLQSEGIEYDCDLNVDNEYILASMYKPIINGFYFFLGEHLPNSISNSLILLKRDNPIKLTNGNIGLYINQNPKLVFYKLISAYFTVHSNGEISNSAIIHPDAKIGKNVQIEHFAVVGKVLIGDNTIIRSHSYVNDGSIIGSNVIIENQSIIGAQGVSWIWNEEETQKIVQPQLGGVEVKNNSFLGANTIIVRGSINENTVVGENTFFAPGCRLGHGTQIEDFVHFANNVVTGGNTKIGNNSFVGSAAVFRPQVKIHESTIVGTGAVVVKNTTAKGKTLVGVPAVEKETKAFPSGMPKPKSIRK